MSSGKEPESDSDEKYMDAVERGDMATAQRMVDEAARAAGYATKGYHATAAKFKKFEYGHVETSMLAKQEFMQGKMDERGFFFYPQRESAEKWMEALKRKFPNSEPTILEVYLKMQKPAPNFYYTEGSGGWEGLREEMKKRDFDSVDDYLGEYVVFDPEQIKLADPVTYDESGNVVPLSRRFDSKNHYIFSGSESWYKRAKSSCWKGYKRVGMKRKGGRFVPNCVLKGKG